MARTFTCLRYFLIGGAIVIAICGVAESICAGYFIYQLYEYASLTPNNVCGSPSILLAMGLIVCLIGWCAWQFLDFTNRGQVIIFSVGLVVITIVNTSAGIWALVRHEQIDTLSIAYLEEMFAVATTDQKPLWDYMQSKLQCCGINGPSDYRALDAIPWSCCDVSPHLNSSDSKGICTTMYGRGCHHVVINRTRSILLHVFLLALSTVLLQVCFISCMSCYARAWRERVDRRKEIMIATQSFTEVSNDLETKDNLLNRHSRYSKASTVPQK